MLSWGSHKKTYEILDICDLRIKLGKSSKISENDIGEKIPINLENVHPWLTLVKSQTSENMSGVRVTCIVSALGEGL